MPPVLQPEGPGGGPPGEAGLPGETTRPQEGGEPAAGAGTQSVEEMKIIWFVWVRIFVFINQTFGNKSGDIFGNKTFCSLKICIKTKRDCLL